jgi:peptide/nickel transport system substrate-binding protein
MLVAVIVASVVACAEPTPTTPSTPTPTTPTTPTTPATPTTPTTPVSGTPKYGGTLVVAEPIFPGDPLGWPPDAYGAAFMFMQHCLQPLLNQDFNGNTSGVLATDWDVAADGSSVTFTLREGVKFHDGTDFNAQAVKFNFDAQMPKKKTSSINWSSVDVIDDYTVRVNLNKWTNYALSDFTWDGGNYIASPTAFEKNGIDWARQNMVGTGPFTQAGYERDVQVVYEKNPNYWDPGKPYVDTIYYKCVKDPMTQVAALKAKELDGMACSADKRLAELEQVGMEGVVVNNGVTVYAPDSIHPESPLANQKVREALEYALDKHAIVDALSYGYFVVCDQFAPPDCTAFDPTIPGRQYDEAKAKQLLTEAGYPNGFEMELLISADEPGPQIAVFMQSYWDAIGVQANIQQLESAKYQEYSRTGWNDGLLYNSPAGASNWVRTLTGSLDPDNTVYISVKRTPEYNDLFNAAATSFEKDPIKEKALVHYIYDTAMVIPVYSKARAWVVWPYVKDGGYLSHSGLGTWDSMNIWLDK